MKNSLLIAICAYLFTSISFATETASINTTLEAISQLQRSVVENQSTLSQTDLIQINLNLTQANELAKSGSSTYTDCRKAGYTHESCNGQKAGYTECRKAGYTHEMCNAQNADYTGCRKAGYTHESCNGQSSGYMTCRKAGFSHESCNKK